MTLKIIPKWMFQLFTLSISLLLLGVLFIWALQDAGLYALIRHQLKHKVVT